MRLIVVFTFVITLLCGSSFAFSIDGSAISDVRIVNGSEAKPGQFPYQISLRNNSNHHRCGGSIISSYWIITAAHCVDEDETISSLFIVVGAHHIKNDGDAYRLSEIIIHSGYKGRENNHENDIGVLKTEREIQFSTRVSPIPLGRTYVDGAVRTVVSGWGRLQLVSARKFFVYCYFTFKQRLVVLYTFHIVPKKKIQILLSV